MKNNTPVTIQLGEKTAALRSYLQLSQAAFAKPLQLSPTHIARFEKGISKPTEAVIKQVCDVFEVNPLYFTEDMPVEHAATLKKPEAGIPERMKAAREEKGWSQYRLAKESKVAQAVINWTNVNKLGK